MNSNIAKYKISSKMESTYKNSINAGEICIWEWNIDKNSIFFSDKWDYIFGTPLKNHTNLYEFIEEFAIESDKKSAINDLQYYLNGNSLNYYSEFRVKKGKDYYIWILVKGKIKKEGLGKGILNGIIYDISSTKNLETEIKKIAYYNSLTELPNRNLFLYNSSAILEECKKANKKGALVFIDIDNFKQVNDTYGHDYGDVLLKVFSQVLTIHSDSYGKVYHLSGDEFLIIVEDISSYNEINELCDSLMESCRNPFEIKDELIYISISIGISIFPDHSTDINQLYKYVDLAMYYSKDHGKNQYTFFDNKINEIYSRQILIEKELKGALANNELYVMYQPQINAETNCTIGLEALLRWNNRRLGNISPAEFIPIAEKNGDIALIGEFVIK